MSTSLACQAAARTDAAPAAVPRPAVLRVALAGCGTVGGALAEQLLAGPLSGDRRVEIVKVLVRDTSRPRRVAFRPGVVTDSLAAFLSAHADVLIETIGGLEPARTVVAAALVQGRRVVTANKALIAAEGAALAQLAARFGGQLDFEGAVGGCIPVVRALRSGAAGVGVTTIRGVLNGTSNFVLDRASAGVAPEAAIRQAQDKGFAEADPSRDLDGIDAADKIAILAWLTFGVAPHMLPVGRRALDDALTLAAPARALGGRAVQLAECEATPQGLVARVEPAIIGFTHDLARATAEWNAVTVESGSAGTILFAGRGAGGDPTAGSLYADLGALSPALPLPRAVQVAGRDERVLRWVLWTRSHDADTAALVPADPDVQVTVLADGARAIAFSGSVAQATTVRAELAERGAEVALARDLRE
jgi:homoserine dehydrogenase